VRRTSNNACDANPGCNTDDTVADTTIQLADVGGVDDAFLLNVCSYPSGIPGSDPSDCVFTPNSGFLTIVKVADPDDATDFVFNLGAGQTSRDGTSSWTITGSGSQQFISFAPGTSYDLNEVVPPGWDLDNAECELQTATPASTGTETSTGVDNFTIQSGVETICSFDDSKAPTLTVTKIVVNDDGGTAVVSDFPLFVDGNSVTSGVKNTVSAGAHTVSETNLSGYTATIGGDCAADGSITLSAGDDKTCTITNDDQQATITVVKEVTNDDGGSAAPDDFDLTLEATRSRAAWRSTSTPAPTRPARPC